MLSVIIPAYQSENYLERCVQSVLTNSIDLEVIIVNDGSTDATPEICQRLSESHKNVRYLAQQNAGAGKARERGLQEAKGEYVSFVDDDDTIVPSAYDIAFNNLQNDTDILMFGVLKINEHGDILETICKKNTILSGSDCVRFFYQNLQEEGLPFLYNKIYRKTLFDGVQFLDTAYGEDFAISAQLFNTAKKIQVISECLYHYIQTDDGLCRMPVTSLKRLDAIRSNRFVRDYCTKKTPDLTRCLYPIACSNDIYLYRLYLNSSLKEKKEALRMIKKDFDENHKELCICSSYQELSLRKKAGYMLFRYIPKLAVKF